VQKGDETTAKQVCVVPESPLPIPPRSTSGRPYPGTTRHRITPRLEDIPLSQCRLQARVIVVVACSNLKHALEAVPLERPNSMGSRFTYTISFSGVGNELSGGKCWGIEGELETMDAMAGE
jgi:hypothetical protein